MIDEAAIIAQLTSNPSCVVEDLAEWLPACRWAGLSDLQAPADFTVAVDQGFGFTLPNTPRQYYLLIFGVTVVNPVEERKFCAVLAVEPTGEEPLDYPQAAVFEPVMAEHAWRFVLAPLVPSFFEGLMQAGTDQAIISLGEATNLQIPLVTAMPADHVMADDLKVLGGGDTTNVLVRATITAPDGSSRRIVFKSYLVLHEFNVEAEMVGRLHAAGFPHVPGLVGSLTMTQGEVTRTLMLAEDFVDNEGDGGKPFWDHLQQVLGDEVPPPISDIAPLARIVGQTTREFHAALVDPWEEAFQEENTTPEDVAAWIHEFEDKYASAADLSHQRLRQLFPTLPPMVLSQALGVLDGLIGAVRGSPLFELQSVPTKQRFHGDLHLAQFLFQGARDPPTFVITDLEGDPQVPPARRRDKKSVWFDLCGLLRALDYIAFFGTLEALKRVDPERGWGAEDVFLAFFATLVYCPLPPYLEDLRDTWSPLVQRARAWVTFVSEELLAGYGIQEMRPQDPPAAAFKLIRATSELNYELRFRGQNALVPLLGVIVAGNDWVQNG